MERNQRFGPLRERPFRLLWLGRTGSAVGDSLIPVALAFAVLDIGGGASGLGVVLASWGLAGALAAGIGIRATLVLAAVLMVVPNLCVLAFVREVRGVRRRTAVAATS